MVSEAPLQLHGNVGGATFARGRQMLGETAFSV